MTVKKFKRLQNKFSQPWFIVRLKFVITKQNLFLISYNADKIQQHIHNWNCVHPDQINSMTVSILAISGRPSVGGFHSVRLGFACVCMEAMSWLITSCMASWTASWHWSAPAVSAGPLSEPHSAGYYQAQVSGPWMDFCLASSATWLLLLVFCS